LSLVVEIYGLSIGLKNT